MRKTLVSLAVVASLATGCGGRGSSDDSAIPADQLSFDGAPAFAGRWYGTATVAVGTQSQSTTTGLELAVLERNLLRILDFCSDGTSPAARVTSATTLAFAPHACKIVFDDCTVTWNIRGGTGIGGGDNLSLAMDGTASGCGVSQPMSLTFTATRTPPGSGYDQGPPRAVVAATAVSGAPNAPIALDATASNDPDGRQLSFLWAVTQQPAGASATLTSATSPRATFTSSVAGAYRVEVTVTATDGQTSTAAVNVNVAETRTITALSHGVLRAEYSRALDRIVFVDGSSLALYVYDPGTGSEAKVSLPLAPQCLSVSPDGAYAVVGHNAWISYVDLGGARLVKTIPVTADVGDCVLGRDGWAYLFPRVDQWVALHSVQLTTGVETNTSSWALYAGARARLHPDGTHIYSITTNLSPQNMERWDTTQGAAVYAWDSPYWGDYPIGRDLWISRDGARVLTAAGSAFRTSATEAQDMVYGGKLSGLDAVKHLDSCTDEIAAIPDTPWSSPTSTVAPDTTVELLNTEYLGHSGRITLPDWLVGASAYVTHGRFVFYSSDCSKKYVVVQADAASGLLRDTAVLTY